MNRGEVVEVEWPFSDPTGNPGLFFTAVQQPRLAELIQHWRTARDNQSTLPPEEQAELDQLVQAKMKETV